jgi:hypothetical protein
MDLAGLAAFRQRSPRSVEKATLQMGNTLSLPVFSARSIEYDDAISKSHLTPGVRDASR